MNNFLAEQETYIQKIYADLKKVSEKAAADKPAEDKWSIKEVLGHLIDSACNNHQRNTRLINTPELIFPAYDQVEWVRYNNYQGQPFSEVLNLWYYYNLHLITLFRNIPAESLKNTWKKDKDNLTLESLVRDYYKHLKHHIDIVYTRLGIK